MSFKGSNTTENLNQFFEEYERERILPTSSQPSTWEEMQELIEFDPKDRSREIPTLIDKVNGVGSYGNQSKKLSRPRKGFFKFHGTIDLHGCNEVEAQKKLEEIFDLAYSNNWRYLRIIHRKGKGIIKKLTHNYLESLNSLVISFSSASPCQGGDGATVVFLRKNKKKQKL